MTPTAVSLNQLSQRWNISAESLRRAFHAGQLRGFQLMGSIRILASEIERIECPTELSNTEAVTPLPMDDRAFASRLARTISA